MGSGHSFIVIMETLAPCNLHGWVIAMKIHTEFHVNLQCINKYTSSTTHTCLLFQTVCYVQANSQFGSRPGYFTEFTLVNVAATNTWFTLTCVSITINREYYYHFSQMLHYKLVISIFHASVKKVNYCTITYYQ